MAGTLRVRKDITKLSQDELTLIIRAWKGIQEKDPHDPNSFWNIASYHGMPFRGAGWGNSAWWGGYCQHGNILFPTWHRAYMLRIEDALRTVPGCEQVTMPYWNEPDAVNNPQPGKPVIPEVLTTQFVELDGKQIPNPLYSYKFQKAVIDTIPNIDQNNPYDYSKPGLAKEYSTVRYPQSGLVGSQNDYNATIKQNKFYGDPIENVKILNNNLHDWLTQDTLVNDQGKSFTAGTAKKFANCLKAPNYTVFSNTTSASNWNRTRDPNDPTTVVPLEAPHNDMHLAIGGFDIPQYNRNQIQGAQGDMGENDTASFDPIFFFHHCWIDNVFWQWQLLHDSELGTKNKLSVIASYPGTNSVDSQGPTPGIPGGSWLTLDTPLEPFINPGATDPKTQPFYTSHDLVNIETQLSYTYENEESPQALLGDIPDAAVVAEVSGISKAAIRGSFNIAVFGTVAGKRQLLGQEAILSRWHTEGCRNCQLNTSVRRFIPLHGITHEHADAKDFNQEVEVFRRQEGGDGLMAHLSPQLNIIKKNV